YRYRAPSSSARTPATPVSGSATSRSSPAAWSCRQRSCRAPSRWKPWPVAAAGSEWNNNLAGSDRRKTVLGRDKKTVREDYRNRRLVAPSAEIRGDIAFSGGLHIQGKVEGNISVSGDGGKLVIGESGTVKGEIRVPDIIINGRVEGDVHAS